MGIFRKLKITFQNLSGRTLRELIAIAVILCISIALSLPALNEDIKQYRIQKAEDDGIESSTAQEQGMDADMLGKAGRYLAAYDASSLIVVRHGKIVLERYYLGDRHSTSNVFSVTKSFISALTGIAIREGFIKDEEDPLEKYLPSYYRNNTNPGWKDINIRHLLMMTPGFSDDMSRWTSSEDWIGFTFGRPLNQKPGQKFEYANSATHLLSAVITDASGMDTLTFAQQNLLEPLHFKNTNWSKDPQGYYTGYANMFLRPRDMAKFGCLYLNNGKWEGKQLVPQEWVQESTKVQYDFNKEEDRGFENGYGLLWWISGETGYHMFSAVGYGGQYIDVIPGLDLVVVITSVPNMALSVDNVIRMELLEKYIIPSIRDKQ